MQYSAMWLVESFYQSIWARKCLTCLENSELKDDCELRQNEVDGQVQVHETPT